MRSGPLGERGPGPLEAVVLFGGLVTLEAFARLVYLRWGFRGVATQYAFTGLLRVLDVLLFLGYWKLRRWTLRDLGLLGPSALRGWSVGIVWGFGCAALAVAAETASRVCLHESLLAAVARRGASGKELAALVVVGGFLGPAAEELAFRGLLYGALRKRLGLASSLILVSLLFASAHAASTPIPLVQAAGGVLFCAAYEASGSLWAPLLLHMSGNVALFLAPLALS